MGIGFTGKQPHKIAKFAIKKNTIRGYNWLYKGMLGLSFFSYGYVFISQESMYLVNISQYILKFLKPQFVVKFYKVQ